ncbi:energy-coupling factor transporter ATPase [Paenibacillus vulneris]|uniref:ATP-binding cassette domain-containing protein n=1 Tax=Paenibacillus vulneris TaxID=1133364 RepID=A0ABW3UTB8_9BACL
MNEAIILSLEQVSCTVSQQDSEKTILRDIHMQIRTKEWVTIVGTNGSGKSTLAKVLSGLYPVAGGTFTACISGNPAAQLVFQNPDTAIIGETVFEDVCFGLTNFGVSGPSLEELAMKALDKVGLAPLAHAASSSLSGGQKQLLAIAGCLAVSPSVYIFDEATSMLDPLARQSILDLAHQLHAEGSTIIWITQLLDELRGSDRVIGLEEGSVVYDGPSREFFYGLPDGGQSPCERLGFAPPFTVQVARRLINRGCRLKSKPLTPDELSNAVRAL